MVSSKSIKLVRAAVFSLILLGIISFLYFEHTRSDIFSINSDISKTEDFIKSKSEALVTTLKCHDKIDDVIVNTETYPYQVNIIIPVSNSLSPEAQSGIETLIIEVFPDSTVTYSYSDESIY